MTRIVTNFRHKHERTSCTCEGCVACCRSMPGMLAPEDLYKIVAEKEDRVLEGEPNREWYAWMNRRTDTICEFVKEHFVASDGALVVYKGEPLRIPTITPKLTETGCVFLDEHDRCKIWEYAPVGCAYFDTHESKEEADPKAQQILRACMMAFESEDHYARVWKWLNDIGCVPAPAAERRERLQAELTRIEGKKGKVHGHIYPGGADAGGNAAADACAGSVRAIVAPHAEGDSSAAKGD